MDSEQPLRDALIATWRTSDRTTRFFVERVPDALWPQKIPGAPRRTVRMILGHMHNARCMWIRTLGREYSLPVPASVDRHRVTRARLLTAFERSNRGILAVLEAALAEGGRLPDFAWRNLPLDVVHFTAYLIAHEAHHRGQIVTVARQLGHRLPETVTAGLWMWSRRADEAEAG